LIDHHDEMRKSDIDGTCESDDDNDEASTKQGQKQMHEEERIFQSVSIVEQR
jgi:hypothetical protein